MTIVMAAHGLSGRELRMNSVDVWVNNNVLWYINDIHKSRE